MKITKKEYLAIREHLKRGKVPNWFIGKWCAETKTDLPKLMALIENRRKFVNGLAELVDRFDGYFKVMHIFKKDGKYIKTL